MTIIASIFIHFFCLTCHRFILFLCCLNFLPSLSVSTLFFSLSLSLSCCIFLPPDVVILLEHRKRLSDAGDSGMQWWLAPGWADILKGRICFPLGGVNPAPAGTNVISVCIVMYLYLCAPCVIFSIHAEAILSIFFCLLQISTTTNRTRCNVWCNWCRQKRHILIYIMSVLHCCRSNYYTYIQYFFLR